MVHVVLNLNTEEDSDNLDEKGRRKRHYGESREYQALPHL
jgi:hypothetical protein